MADQIDVPSLLKSSWDFLSKNINKLWPVAILFALPALISPFSSNSDEAAEYTIDNFSDLARYSEVVFGVSLATLSAAIILFLIVFFLYSALVYSGSIKLMLKSLRGRPIQIKASQIFSISSRYLGKFLLLSLAGGAIIVLGFILLFVPGLIAIFLLSLALHFMVDKDLSVSESLSSSYRTVKKNAGSVFMVYLGLMVVGLAASIVGSILFGADVWLTRVLSAGLEGFVSLYGLIVVTKLYIKLSGKTTTK